MGARDVSPTGAPSGRLTAMLVVAGLSPRRLLETLKKCPVAPELIIIGGERVDILGLIIWLILFKLLA
jgi:chorismate synthase